MSAALKLFEISGQFHELEKLAITDDLPSELIADTLESLHGDFNDKALAVAKFILSMEANADAIKQASEAMRRRSDSVKRRADSVRAYLLFNLQSVDIKRIESAELVLSRRDNPVAVQVTDESVIPRQYFVQPEPPPPRLDKKAVKEALQAGEHVAGAYLESGERLDIRI